MINTLSSCLWSGFLPLIIILGLFVTYKTIKLLDQISRKDATTWKLDDVRSSLSISLASKVGTGAIIGVLAAMNKISVDGNGGESIVLWVMIGMIFLIPVTYSEVLYCQITKKTPREFIEDNINKKAGFIYMISLVILYCFGFVGFQLTGIQSVSKIVFKQYFNYEFTQSNLLLYIVIPLILVVSLIVISKNYRLFINTLGSMVSIVIVMYSIFFITFIALTKDFIPLYAQMILEDFLSFKSATIGLPLGMVIGFQRIIQTSETSLGTNALASHGSHNSPRREALLQTVSTIITIFIAVVITSYVFTYGRYNIHGVVLSNNGFERILSYLISVKTVTGDLGLGIIISFFILSGLTTILGSYHFLNKSMDITENRKILFYIVMITLSGIFSITNFDIIFDAADLLMFIVGSINIVAMAKFATKDIDKYKYKLEWEDYK